MSGLTAGDTVTLGRGGKTFWRVKSTEPTGRYGWPSAQIASMASGLNRSVRPSRLRKVVAA